MHPIHALLTDGPAHPETRQLTVEVVRPADQPGFFLCLHRGQTLNVHGDKLRLRWQQPRVESREGNAS